MADLDGHMLDAKLGTILFLLIQMILAVIDGILAYLAGRRSSSSRIRVGFVVALILVASAGCGNLYLCSKAQDSIQGRMDGRVPGPFASEQKAQNHLGLMQAPNVECGSLLAGTVFGIGILYWLARRRCEPSSALEGI
jgi:hypothetical protein